jgi:hypothetical protein
MKIFVHINKKNYKIKNKNMWQPAPLSPTRYTVAVLLTGYNIMPE